MAIKVKKTRSEHQATIALGGELDFHTSSDLRLALEEVLAVPGVRELVLDLKGLTLIDSSGLGMLLFASKEMEKREGKVLLRANSLVMELLKVTNLEQFFEIIKNGAA